MVILKTNYEAPQCGEDEIRFEGWDEVDEYFCENPEAEQDLKWGYAKLIERK